MQPAALSVFVYFRASTSDASRVLEAMDRHRAAIAARGFELCLSRRLEDAPDSTTWMESYPQVQRASLSVLTAAVSASARDTGLESMAIGGRHLEIFEPVQPCA